MSQNELVKILLIEDDEADIELLDASLGEVNGFRYELFPVNAIEKLNSELQKAEFTIVIMDLGLKLTCGIETYRALKALDIELPVIIVTGLDDEQVGLQAINEGAQDYLVKGKFDGQKVVQVIRYAIARFQIEKQLQQSEERSRILINENVDGIVVLGKNNKIRFFNPSASKYLSLDEQSYNTVFNQHINDHKDIKLETKNSADEVCFLEGKSVTIYWEGELAKLVTLRDVSNIHNMEESLRNSNTELRQLKRELEKDLADSVTQMLQNDAITLNRTMQNNPGQLSEIQIDEINRKINSLDIVIKNLQDAIGFGEISTEQINTKLKIAGELVVEIAELLT